MSKKKKAYNAADEDLVEERKSQEEIEREEELNDIKSILKTKAGVRFFKRFFDNAYMFQTSFTGNSSTFFNEGRRDLALLFFGDVCESCPDKVSQLLMRGE